MHTHTPSAYYWGNDQAGLLSADDCIHHHHRQGNRAVREEKQSRYTMSKGKKNMEAREGSEESQLKVKQGEAAIYSCVKQD